MSRSKSVFSTARHLAAFLKAGIPTFGPPVYRAPEPPEPYGRRYLPIIEDLAAAKSDFERAEWLLTTPISILYKHSMAIREVLLAATYNKGHNYVLLLFATQSMRRDLDGKIRGPMQDALDAAIEDLREDAERPPLRASHDQRVMAAADLTIDPVGFMGVDLADGPDFTVRSFHPPGGPIRILDPGHSFIVHGSKEDVALAVGVPGELLGRTAEVDRLTFNWPEPKTQPTS